MPSHDDYRKELNEIRAQGVFAIDPAWITTPLRMAAFAQAKNGREAKRVAVEVEAAAKLGEHQLLTVGEFFSQHRAMKGAK